MPYRGQQTKRHQGYTKRADKRNNSKPRQSIQTPFVRFTSNQSTTNTHTHTHIPPPSTLSLANSSSKLEQQQTIIHVHKRRNTSTTQTIPKHHVFLLCIDEPRCFLLTLCLFHGDTVNGFHSAGNASVCITTRKNNNEEVMLGGGKCAMKSCFVGCSPEVNQR